MVSRVLAARIGFAYTFQPFFSNGIKFDTRFSGASTCLVINLVFNKDKNSHEIRRRI